MFKNDFDGELQYDCDVEVIVSNSEDSITFVGLYSIFSDCDISKGSVTGSLY